MVQNVSNACHVDIFDDENEAEAIRKAVGSILTVQPMWEVSNLVGHIIGFVEKEVTAGDMMKLLAPRISMLAILLAVRLSKSLQGYMGSRKVGVRLQLAVFIYIQASAAWACASMEPGIYQHRLYLFQSVSIYAFFTMALHVPSWIQLYGYSCVFILCWIAFHTGIGYCSLEVVLTGIIISGMTTYYARDKCETRRELFRALTALQEAQNASEHLQLAQHGMLQSIFEASCFCDHVGTIVKSTLEVGQLLGATEGMRFADFAATREERVRLCSFLEGAKSKPFHMASMMQTTLYQSSRAASGLHFKTHQNTVEVKVVCIKVAAGAASSQSTTGSIAHLNGSQFFLGVQQLSTSDTKPAEYRIAFDAGSPDFQIIHGGSDSFFGGMLTSSSLLTSVPTPCHDLLDAWICDEVQNAPDHRRALSASSMSGLRLDVNVSVIVERAWLEMDCSHSDQLAAELPVHLKLQGIRPLQPEDFKLTPSICKRTRSKTRLASLTSLLYQLPEVSDEDNDDDQWENAQVMAGVVLPVS